MPKRKAPIGSCRLCTTHGPLRDSHIIPELMYKPLYDNNHRAVAVLSNRHGPVEILQKGYREYLLCQSCETRFSGWETPSTPVWRQAVGQLRNGSPGMRVTVPADYSKFKLFALSLLWRACVATHDNFSSVDLRSSEPIIRQMLLSDTPGAVTEFQSVAFAWANLNHLVGVIGPCGGGLWQDVPTFRLNISGIQWFFFAEPTAASLVQDPAVSHQGFTVVVSPEDESVEIARMAKQIVSL